MQSFIFLGLWLGQRSLWSRCPRLVVIVLWRSATKN